MQRRCNRGKRKKGELRRRIEESRYPCSSVSSATADETRITLKTVQQGTGKRAS
jgi:hypothetical protein